MKNCFDESKIYFLDSLVGWNYRKYDHLLRKRYRFDVIYENTVHTDNISSNLNYRDNCGYCSYAPLILYEPHADNLRATNISSPQVDDRWLMSHLLLRSTVDSLVGEIWWIWELRLTLYGTFCLYAVFQGAYPQGVLIKLTCCNINAIMNQ